jgi:hypothetical protein
MSNQRWIKVGTLYGDMAEKILNVVSTVGILRYQERTVEGRTVVDVFTDSYELKKHEEEIKCPN